MDRRCTVGATSRTNFRRNRDMVNKFEDILAKRHANAARWKQDGKKIVGYLCSYGMEEVLHAAGLQPVRIIGVDGPYNLSKDHIQPYYCDNCHGAVNEALKGSYKYLDGLIFPYSCEHGRATYDSWRINVPIGYTRFVDMPSQTDLPQAEEMMIKELQNLISSLETKFDVKITELGLRESISLHNRNRSLLKEIYGYKKADDPVVSGAEVFAAIMSSTVARKEEHNDLLEDFLKELDNRKDPVDGGPRLIAIGTEVHDPNVIKAMEEAGVRVVADELCTGTRLVWENVSEERDPLKAIAARYLTGVNCPVKRPAEKRMEHLKKMADDYKIEGVMVLHPRHCDPNEWDLPFIVKMFEDKGIPIVQVELESVFNPGKIKQAVEELKTRL
jgi:benzoyl-CoA reductase subunit C